LATAANFLRRSSSRWISRRAADGRLDMRAGMMMDGFALRREHEAEMVRADAWGGS
jgi:hypothetical protein